MQGQGLGAVLVVVGEDQFIIIYEDGIHKQNAETIILLHGGGLSWWNYREIAKLLEEDYHIVLPMLDGHADSE